MKKIINSLLIFILGGIIFGGIVYGVNNYPSNAIEYSPTDSSWEVSNVSDALNDLYNNYGNSELNDRYYFNSYNGANYGLNENVTIDLSSYKNYKNITKDDIIVVISNISYNYTNGAWATAAHNWQYDIKNSPTYDAKTGELSLNFPLNQSKGYNYGSESVIIDVDIYIIESSIRTNSYFKSYSGNNYTANEKIILDLKSYKKYKSIITDNILIVVTKINYNYTNGPWSTNSHSWNYNNMKYIPSYRQINGNLYLNYPLKISPVLNYGTENFYIDLDIYIFD